MAIVIIDEKNIDELLTRGVEQVFPNKKFLQKALSSDKPIKLYYGIDPTGTTLHLGHMVQLLKLKQFQDMGHEVIILIGDFTAQIGDPTGKDKSRRPLTHKQVLENAIGYKKQIGQILDISHSKIRFVHNEKWSNKLKPVDLLELASHFTVAQFLERDMFQERIKAGKNIHLHEFLYPLFQAYDAVTLDVDLQIGGNDQMFNMLAGRDLMKKIKNQEKAVLTTKMLEDPTGKKMGKSEGNMVSLADSPAEMYGKIMSWPDGMIAVGLELLTHVPIDEIGEIKKQIKSDKVNPRDLKMKLAHEVIRAYLGDKAAKEGEESFKQVFQKGEKPSEIPEVVIDPPSPKGSGEASDVKIGVLDLFVQAGLASSNSEMRRLIKDGGIKIDDKKVEKEDMQVKIPAGGLLLQKGKKRFARAMIK